MKIRPIRPHDKEGLLAGFERLSEDSRYKRFLTPMDTLTSSQLRYRKKSSVPPRPDGAPNRGLASAA